MIRSIRRSMKRAAMKKTAVAALSVMMLAGGCLVSLPEAANVRAATEHWNDASTSADWQAWKDNWETYSSNYENVSLTPGEDESQLNFAWYSKTTETPQVRIADNQNMTNPVVFEGEQDKTAISIESESYYSNKVIAKNLKANTAYYYQVFQDGKWQDVQKYTTKSFDNYSFLYVGDPQIGASSGQTNTEGDKMADSTSGTAAQNLAARNDGYNWNKVLNDAVKAHSNVSFIASAGDQVNTSTNERQYAAYLGADALKSLPVATTIGNHDSSSEKYTMHYNNPNTDSLASSKYTQGQTKAGTDYYYTYGNTLFIVLDTNNYNCNPRKCYSKSSQ